MKCDTGHHSEGSVSCTCGVDTIGTLQCVPDTCDASSVPTNGQIGDCTSTLAHATTCAVTCDAGFHLTGTRSCHLGRLDDDVLCVGDGTATEQRFLALESLIVQLKQNVTTAQAKRLVLEKKNIDLEAEFVLQINALQNEFDDIDAVCLTGGNGRMLASNAPCGRQTSAPQAGEVVVVTQTLSITGVTAAEVCTENGKKLIQEAVAKSLSVRSSFVEISKCSDLSRRSRHLLAGGVDLEYKVTLPASEATASKQSAMLSSMAKMDDEDSGVISAIAEAAGKDVSAITVSGSSPTVEVHQANATDNNDNVVANDAETSSPAAGILLVLFLLGVGGFISYYIFKQKNKENEIVTTFNNNSFSSPKEIECVIFNADYFQKEVETRTNKKMMNDALLLWLNELNLGDHYLTFIEEELESISDLRLLSDEHFKKLGLELSDRRKIRAHVLLYMQDEHCSAKQDYDDFSLPKPDDDFSLPKPEIKK